ncbi:extracellular solute-binding protein [Halobacillus sp. ACCC02827]|uniref:ABC transporter substrate-binding protein n=1 Tax=Bacillaceae TaxID=186817 RepID=UPI0002A4E8ED|nr:MULTISPECIES: extracellular solute-binding protein [Bacillaceae]ELK46583.1 lactose transporter lactose-binding protein [Halobacillus sp. BAB-2008]QHT45495.1 extracellular solute-binding protein [Bacillus sp. SB49]WJE16293.1 extracellular solute-binding protein [Halobacillus sp. ACCC02827]
MKGFLFKKSWVFALALIAIFTLAACSSDESSGSDGGGEDSNKVTAWAWDPKFNIAALEIAKDAYEGDAEIEIIENAQDDIVQKLNTGLSSGTMKGMPNIVLIEDQRAQSFLKSYPDAFYPIDDYMNPDDFASYKIAPTSLDGKQYGLPFDTGVMGLYFRTDYLEEAGYTKEDLTDITWDEFIAIGKDVKEKTGKDMVSMDPNDLGIVRAMIQSAGKWYVEEDGETLNIEGNEALKKAFETYKSMMEADIVKANSDWSQYVAAFNSGDIATVPTGNWIGASIMAEESQSGKWAVAPIPKLDVEGAVNASNLGGSSFYVLNIDGKEKAAEFLGETFGSNTDFYQDLITEVGAVATYSPAAEGEAYQQESEFFGGQKLVSDLSEWTNEIPAVDYGTHTYAIEDILVAEMQNYLNGKELDAVLADAQAQAEAQLK